jgi:UDP-3-O-[3-hydroxymyristoyl] glucosamine N-acyltransferase
MTFTAQQIALILKGEVEGNPSTEITTFAKIEEGFPGALSFLANMKYEEFLYSCESSVVIVNNDFKPNKAVKATLIRVTSAYEAFATLLQKYEEIKQRKTGREAPIFIGEKSKIGTKEFIGAFVKIGDNSKIGNNVTIQSNVVIGDHVHIGNDVIIYGNVTINSGSKIADNVTIHSGSVIGSDGFGFAPNSDNEYNKIPQIGNVIIEERVEIGANCCIDRATMGSTIIKAGVKLDNFIQIAHNVEVGENTVIAAQSGVAGSTKIGKNCMIGGQVGIVGHITIANGVKIAAQSGIGKTIKKENSIWQGSPASEIKEYHKNLIRIKNLHSLQEKLNNLEKEIAKLSHQE